MVPFGESLVILPPPPPVLLILGTDAAGKDYVADFLIRHWRIQGYSTEKRAGTFAAAPVDDRSSSERKGRWGRFKEQLFIRVFPLIRGLTPWLTQILLVRDQRRFRPPAQPVVVVSHTALRLLALAQGQATPPPPLSPTLIQALHTLQTTTGATVIVLDIAPAIRQKHIVARVQQGTVDPFDQYMLADIERAERIEQSLVTLATAHLHAVVIENNNLTDDALTAALAAALTPSAYRNR
jgi:hypothetical protein